MKIFFKLIIKNLEIVTRSIVDLMDAELKTQLGGGSQTGLQLTLNIESDEYFGVCNTLVYFWGLQLGGGGSQTGLQLTLNIESDEYFGVCTFGV